MCGVPDSGAMAKCWATPDSTDEDKGLDQITAPVGSFPGDVSPWGVHDMAGNVVEPTADWFSGFYYFYQIIFGLTTDPIGRANPTPVFGIPLGGWSSPERVYKSWGFAMSGTANSNYNRFLDTAWPLRGAHRTFHHPHGAHWQIGFRVMKE